MEARGRARYFSLLKHQACLGEFGVDLSWLRSSPRPLPAAELQDSEPRRILARGGSQSAAWDHPVRAQQSSLLFLSVPQLELQRSAGKDRVSNNRVLSFVNGFADSTSRPAASQALAVLMMGCLWVQLINAGLSEP